MAMHILLPVRQVPVATDQYPFRNTDGALDLSGPRSAKKAVDTKVSP